MGISSNPKECRKDVYYFRITSPIPVTKSLSTNFHKVVEHEVLRQTISFPCRAAALSGSAEWKSQKVLFVWAMFASTGGVQTRTRPISNPRSSNHQVYSLIRASDSSNHMLFLFLSSFPPFTHSFFSVLL